MNTDGSQHQHRLPKLLGVGCGVFLLLVVLLILGAMVGREYEVEYTLQDGKISYANERFTRWVAPWSSLPEGHIHRFVYDWIIYVRIPPAPEEEELIIPDVMIDPEAGEFVPVEPSS